MPKLSTRTLYLFLAFSITLLFAGTGIYYLLTVNKAPIEESSTEQSGPRIVAQTSPSPAPTYVPQLESETSFEDPSSQTEESSESAKTLDLSCYEPCSYDYQCPANLSCISLNGEKKCSDPDCPQNSSCTCSQTTPAIGGVNDEEDFTSYPEEDFSEQELANYPQETFELESYDTSPTQTPTPRSTPNPSASPKSKNLPQAGNLELTFALLAFGVGIILTSSSFLKRT